MHQKIIFVNGHLFPFTYPGGAGYWLGANSPFIKGAHTLLNSQLPPHFTDIKHRALSSVTDRVLAGWKYAKENEHLLAGDLSPVSDRFNFVTHSMGAAFAEGMILFLQEEAYTVGNVIHFNAFQAAAITANRRSNLPGCVIDYQSTNDPLINNPVYAKPGEISNADLKIRHKSKTYFFKRHRDPIESAQSWQIISSFMRTPAGVN